MIDSIISEKNYFFFSQKRKDISSELVDAISANTQADSVVKLSLSQHFRRKYSSVQDAIENFPQEKTKKQLQLVANLCLESSGNRPFNLVATDCTPYKRLYSHKLKDRSYIHAPNPISTNKPISVGHKYSWLAYLPEKEPDKNQSPWILPLSVKRVPTQESDSNIGINQLKELMMNGETNFKDTLCVNVADCGYSNCKYLHESGTVENLVQIVRLAGHRVLYRKADRAAIHKRKGHPSWYGSPFKLKVRETWGKPHAEEIINWVTARGKELSVKIQAWNNLLVRGKRDTPMHNKPLKLVRITVSNQAGELVYKRPLWLILAGEKKDEISLKDVWSSYRQRFDLEHFFRFGKTKLLMDKYQTPDVEHEESWMQFCLLAYIQLYLGKEIAVDMPNPWEKYKNAGSETQSVKSPSMVQRDFDRILEEIGTFAKPPKTRGISAGRKIGEKQNKRQVCPVLRKSKKKSKKSTANSSFPQKSTSDINSITINLGTGKKPLELKLPNNSNLKSILQLEFRKIVENIVNKTDLKKLDTYIERNLC